MEYVNKILQGNCKDRLKELPDKSVRCCVTSPPYFGLRDYGTGKWEGGDPGCSHFKESKGANANTGQKNDMQGCGDSIYKDVCPKCGATRVDEQIGLEETPEQYVSSMVGVFEEVKRVLADDGTLWVNLGDSYAATRGYQVNHGEIRGGQEAREAGAVSGRGMKASDYGLKPKDLIGIPWMVAFALRAAGWYLRQDIIWHKPNPMPESVTDRCTKAHEYIFLLSKSRQYFYDHEAIKTEIKDASVQRLLRDVENQTGSGRVPGKTNGNMKAVGHKNMQRQDKNHSFHESRKGSGADDTHALNGSGVKGHSGNFGADGELIGGGMANKKSVWTVTTKPFSLGLKTYHWALLEGGVPSYGNLSIASLDCPIYGGLFDLLAILLCDAHEGDNSLRISDIDNYLSVGPRDGFVPIQTLHAWGCGEHNLDCFLLDSFVIATSYSKQIRKRDLFVSTTLSCKPSAERASHIRRILDQRGLFALSHDTPWNNISVPDFDDNRRPQTLHCIVGTQELEHSFSCVQTYERKTKNESHFATFPEDLIKDCIKAGSEEGDIILDPFSGAGTTAMVAQKLNRNFVGIELNPKYIDIAERRLRKEIGMFLVEHKKRHKDTNDERSVAENPK